MTPERFLAEVGPAPLDEDEIREAVWQLLFARAPPGLVRVVGKQVYHKCEASTPAGQTLTSACASAEPVRIAATSAVALAVKHRGCSCSHVLARCVP